MVRCQYHKSFETILIVMVQQTNSTRILKLMSFGLGNLFTLRFWSFFKTIFPLNTTDMLLFALIVSGKSQSVLDSIVKTLLN